MFEYYQLTHLWPAYVLLGLVSLSIGSLLNVVIYRLPIMLQTQWHEECQLLLNQPITKYPVFNLFWPRSQCPHCQHTINAIDNIPLLSFMIRRGQCRYCLSKISWQYPIIEMLTCLLSLMTAYCFGFNSILLFALLLLWLIIPIVFIDLKFQLIPDSLSISLLWLGLAANSFDIFTSANMAIWGGIIGYLSLYLFIKLYYLITGKIGMGNGDFKLFAAFGVWFGPQSLLFIILCASVIGATIGSIYLSLCKKNRETPIPFGPFLCIAAILFMFIGKQAITMYTHWN